MKAAVSWLECLMVPVKGPERRSDYPLEWLMAPETMLVHQKEPVRVVLTLWGCQRALMWVGVTLLVPERA